MAARRRLIDVSRHAKVETAVAPTLELLAGEGSLVRLSRRRRALRAHLLKQLGHFDGAALAYTRAIGLTEDVAVREFLTSESGA